MSGNRKACMFCGSTSNKISREHVFRSALRKYVPDIGPVFFQNYESGQIRDLGNTMFDQTIRKVCKPCNEGWMESLEVEVEPALSALMLGKLTTITPVMATGLARWAAKTHLVRARTVHAAAAPPSEAKRVMEHEALSHHWRVTLFRYDGATARDLLRHFDNDVYSYLPGDESSTTHLGKLRTQEHIVVMGKVVIYSRFDRHPEAFTLDIDDSWAQAFEALELDPFPISPAIPAQFLTSDVPQLMEDELWRPASVLAWAYQHQTGHPWKGREFNDSLAARMLAEKFDRLGKSQWHVANRLIGPENGAAG